MKLLVLLLSFSAGVLSTSAFAGEPKAAFCRDKAIQVAAFVTVVNDANASVEKLSPALTDFSPEGPDVEDYGTEVWEVSNSPQPPVSITFRVTGPTCFVQEISVAGL